MPWPSPSSAAALPCMASPTAAPAPRKTLPATSGAIVSTQPARCAPSTSRKAQKQRKMLDTMKSITSLFPEGITSSKKYVSGSLSNWTGFSSSSNRGDVSSSRGSGSRTSSHSRIATLMPCTYSSGLSSSGLTQNMRDAACSTLSRSSRLSCRKPRPSASAVMCGRSISYWPLMTPVLRGTRRSLFFSDLANSVSTFLNAVVSAFCACSRACSERPS
mmetsp:Transcript_8515/g.21895  ORF Transcript_8515/g.21895 Transcript_8515/m.21895 type:complete len:217 (-) Transcript_8515:745-1395(-)